MQTQLDAIAADLDDPTEDKMTQAREQTKEEHLAVLLILKHDLMWYVSLVIDLQNNCMCGSHQYMTMNDRIPTFNPSNDPTTVPGNSSLARPLAQPSHLGELTINIGYLTG